MGADVRAGPVRRAFDWLFRNRTTGAITVVQVPNLALTIFFVAAIVRRVADPAGSARAVITVIATAALLWWAVGEVGWGVNPFRRLLGAFIIVATVVGLAAR
ncbi:MAG: hypothetical protein QOG87_1585 [Actinomycetota bacterium]